jgi:uncharacterized cupin superfamily protein
MPSEITPLLQGMAQRRNLSFSALHVLITLFVGILIGVALPRSSDTVSATTTMRAFKTLEALNPSILRLTQTLADISAEITHEDVLDGQLILSGHPSTSMAVQFTGKSYEVGSWSCEVGSWSHVQAGDEFIQLVEGAMEFRGVDGKIDTVVAPASFLLPDGWTGVWNVTRAVKKFWVA